MDVAFVIGPDGIAEDGSLAALRADRLEFLQATLNALPAFRFRPLVLEGCPVRAIVEMPFAFKLSR